ncbi:MAG: methionine gamma-lyase family protein [Sporomusaceae bacterium]|nr:methionine gamma-lyase family protein [Sporomusaceae bacterium]
MTQVVKSIAELKKEALAQITPFFAPIEEISQTNTKRVLDAFRESQISDHHFQETTGYGYGDGGREKLDEVWAAICGAEKAIVRPQFVSGTHALACVLFALLKPGDELLAATGTPYDTMQTVIGKTRSTPGSLTETGIIYREIPMTETGVNLAELKKNITAKTKMILIQRSRGYSLRKALSLAEIKKICALAHEVDPELICFVDNCYGEFMAAQEPTAAGADIMAGSFIKNPGGGLAPGGGYIAGKKELVEAAACRLTAPGLGSSLGSAVAGRRLFFQGIFLAPHVVAQALKGALFTAALFSLLGYKVIPSFQEARQDIIQAIELKSAEKMLAFCRGLQKYSPVDAYVTPIPGEMPGYSDQVIMAGGTFIQGSSIELSADGPLREPYLIYLQGALSFEHAILGATGAAEAVGYSS